MSRLARTGTRLVVASITLLACVAGANASASPPPTTQALPVPISFVSNLDLECFATAPYTPPLTLITTRHLNPALSGLPTESHVLGPRNQLCVPVAKNGRIPPPALLEFVQYVDLSCYQIQGQTVNFLLPLRHLNPLLQNLFPKYTVMLQPDQLCLPVVKNNAPLPAEVLRLVSYIDLKCYRVSNQTPLGLGLTLTQLNPVLAGLPPTNVSVRESRRLCVPVQKNDQVIPPEILNIVRWVNLEKYDIIAPSLTVPINLTISHINPLLTSLPPESVSLSVPMQLALPVGTNFIPPATWPSIPDQIIPIVAGKPL